MEYHKNKVQYLLYTKIYEANEDAIKLINSKILEGVNNLEFYVHINCAGMYIDQITFYYKYLGYNVDVDAYDIMCIGWDI